jgi:Mg/Co/Ni transporter MgtE
MEDARLAEIVGQMASDDAADIVGELAPQRADQILNLVRPEQAQELRQHCATTRKAPAA